MPTDSEPFKDLSLEQVAARLVWWQTPSQALGDPLRFVAQVMALGTDRDVRVVESRFGPGVFDAVLDRPPPGLFSPRRWNYWHVRQRRTPVPALPRRFRS
jgi:hypothetical protein